MPNLSSNGTKQKQRKRRKDDLLGLMLKIAII